MSGNIFIGKIYICFFIRENKFQKSDFYALFDARFMIASDILGE